VFATVDAAQAFGRAVDETCRRFAWRLHANVMMRDHFHSALETPQPNLSEGMHPCAHVSSRRLLAPRSVGAAFGILRQRARPPWLSAGVLLGALASRDSSAGWKEYDQFLAALGSDPREQERLGFGRLSRGWAIGTHAWMRQLAREHRHTALPAGLDRDECQETQAATWNEYLSRSLMPHGRTLDEAAVSAADVTWKVAVAAELRDLGVPYRWISHTLHVSKPRIVGSIVFCLRERRMA
jgi:putative transposase